MGTWAIFLVITGIFEAAKSNLLKNAHIRFVTGSHITGEKVMIASSSFLINGLISVIFIIIVVFFSGPISGFFNSGKDLTKMLLYFIPGILFMVVFSHLEAVLQSFLDFKGVFSGYLIRQLFFFLVIVGYKIMDHPLSLPQLALYQSISIGLGMIILYFEASKYLEKKFIYSFFWIRKIFGYGGYIFLSGMLANIASNIDQIMIARFLNINSVAYYNVASRINGLVDIPSYAAADILFPKAAQASVNEGKEKLKYFFERMVGILTAFNLPVAFLIILFPGVFIHLIAGEKYEPAVLILQLYMITGIFRPFQNQAANIINSMGNSRLNFIINAVALSIFLIINLYCLKTFGFLGAAIGTLVTNLIGFVCWYFIMKNKFNTRLSQIFKYTIDTYKNIFIQIIKISKLKITSSKRA